MERSLVFRALKLACSQSLNQKECAGGKNIWNQSQRRVVRGILVRHEFYLILIFVAQNRLDQLIHSPHVSWMNRPSVLMRYSLGRSIFAPTQTGGSFSKHDRMPPSDRLMRKDKIQANCPRCKHQQFFLKAEINYLLHPGLTIITGGLWLVNWMALCTRKLMRPWRCEQCGWHKPEFGYHSNQYTI